MFLRSLTLKGFKSFPDRTKLEFDEGVSVIVGPNGSGKSNVTDAVLWALGEQSPLAVRGSSMQDVIFAGGHGRPSGREAEVELVLDNGCGTLGIGLTEVSILRRLDRSGEGEYRLNGARCRLVDVLEVLSDTGLGKEMHSVVSQGRVEGIVTSKPRDRRLLIEEAAGLGKHRKRRRRAQLKLERTQENLDRALDVEREARSRLRPLKRQAEAAELHARLERQALEARWELARDDARAARADRAAGDGAATAARAAREREEAALAEVAARREAAEEALQARAERREALGRRAYAARAAGERLGFRLESVRTRADGLAEAAARHRAELDGLERETAADAPDPEAAARIAALEAEHADLGRGAAEELERDLAELETARAAAAAGAEGRVAAAETLVTRVREAEALCTAARATRREAERAVEEARRAAAAVGADLAAANQFLRVHAAAPGGARALAGELSVEDGLELALAAALGGLLAAAIAPDLAVAGSMLERAGRDGGAALVGGPERAAPAPSAPPRPGARRLIDAVSGPADAVGLATPLLADAWVVDDVDGIPDEFTGIAVTPAGRVWFGARRELRQVPAGGTERLLAERAKRDELIEATERVANAERQAVHAAEGAAGDVERADAARDEADAAARAARARARHRP